MRTIGGRSSDSSPSSSATTAIRAGQQLAIPSRSTRTSPESSTAARRPAVPALMRSAIGTTTMPPSASANKPRSATGRPADSVAVRSNPPSRRASGICAGIRRTGVPATSRLFRAASQASRTGPGAARTTTPPRPTGSTANKAAAASASCQRGSVKKTPHPSRARPEYPNRSHRADCAAGDDARPKRQSVADANPEPIQTLRMQPVRAPYATR